MLKEGLNFVRTATLNFRWNFIEFESWINVEMPLLNQRWNSDVDSIFKSQRTFNVVSMLEHDVESLLFPRVCAGWVFCQGLAR